IESFNGRFRQECLNQHWFLSLEDDQEQVDSWREDYNQRRPHSSLGTGPQPSSRNFWTGRARPKTLSFLAFPLDQTWGQGHSHNTWTRFRGAGHVNVVVCAGLVKIPAADIGVALFERAPVAELVERPVLLLV